jgi:hypothetical protein
VGTDGAGSRDHASVTVPTPKAVLSDIAGARENLPYSKEVYAYMRLFEKSSPRVRVVSIGTTEGCCTSTT